MVSLIEVPVAWLSEKGHMTRRGAATLTGVVMFALGVPATLSQSPVLAKLTIFGKNVFDLFDFCSSNVLLPVGGLAIAILGGWVLARKDFVAEMELGYDHEPWHGRVLIGILKFVTPVLITAVLLSSLGVIKL
jgi:NSS family neurotransmitter:Na+ symporter